MNLWTDITGMSGDGPDLTMQAQRHTKKSAWGPWATDAETDGEMEGKGAMSESDFEIASTLGHRPGDSTYSGRAFQ
jgi:nicotinamide N-methyltransferase